MGLKVIKRKKIIVKQEKKIDKRELFGVLLAILTAIVSGVSIVANRLFIIKIDPFVFTTIRSFFIGLVFLVISFFACNFKIKKFRKVSWWTLVLIGIIGGSAPFLLFFIGLKETTAGRAAFLQKTLPLYATLLAFFFLKEKITKAHVLAMLSMIVGVYLIESANIPLGIRIGDLLVLGAALLWAVESTISKKAMLDNESNWVITFSRMFFGSLILFSIIAIMGKADMLFSLNKQQIIYIIISTLLLLFYVLFWYWGLRFINLSKASIILLIAPLISLILGHIWLRERIFELQLLGSTLVLIGAFLILRTKSEKRIIEV
jgi:drug/metabolite transporter (DMT)-like permease